MHNDEGFREIQLNGKQLVFLFMAATVVLVVTFLFGLLVGRGAPGRPEAASAASVDVVPDQAVSPMPESPPPAAPAAGVQTENKAERPEELSYAERLLRDTPPDEKLKPAAPQAVEPAPPAPAVREPVVAQPPRERPAPAAAAPVAARTATTGPAASDPAGPGFAVQVSISETRREADQLANQLIAKGYPAFVVDPVKGTPKQIYRIRVGKYKTRKDAEEVLARLEKNEHFKPWIAR